MSTATRARPSVLAPPGVRSGLRPWLARNGLAAALVVMVVAAVLLAGGWTYLGLPGSDEGKLIDLMEGALLLWLLVPVVRERRLRLLAAIGVYVALVLSGVVYSHAPSAGISTALRNWLLLPVLAVLLAARGRAESLVRTFVTALLVLGAIEFGVTIVQVFVSPNPAVNADLITGTFGTSSQNDLAIVVLLIACLGAAGYLIGAPRGLLALFAGMLFPVFSAWGVAKLATLALPAVVFLIVVAALLGRRTTRRRAAICFACAIASSGVVMASYAVFFPDAFRTFTSAGSFNRYLNTGSADVGGNLFTGGLTPLQRGPELHRTVVGAVENANVAVTRVPVWRTDAFTVTNKSVGRSAVYLQTLQGHVIRVRGRQTYGFSSQLANQRHVPLIQAGVIWFSQARRFLRVDETRPVRLPGNPSGGPDSVRPVELATVAPAGAAYAFPYLRSLGFPPKGASFHILAARFAPASPALATATARHHLVRELRTPHGLSWFHIHPDFPGHLAMLRMSLTAISGGLGSELFGQGLGAASPQAVTAHGGGPENRLPDNAAAGAHSDAGTIIVERGLIGLATVVLAAVGLCLLSVVLLPRLPSGQWSSAITLAVPGAVAVLGIYGLMATGLQIHPSALIFWLIVGLGLAPALADRPRVRP